MSGRKLAERRKAAFAASRPVRIRSDGLIDGCPVDRQTGELLPVVTIVTDNGGPFRSFRFETFIELHPELAHVRTRVRTPGQNGSRERGFETLEYERAFHRRDRQRHDARRARRGLPHRVHPDQARRVNDYRLDDPDDGHVAHVAILGKPDAIVTDDIRAGFRASAALRKAAVDVVYPAKPRSTDGHGAERGILAAGP